ncbi:MAG TPA: acyl-CoA thioester hydrolase/BAAT C-terminal domain-containing protein [Chthoniobacterales bacterium]|nr:acyl-CoA thioester hydrolase/BAAT C-terminal domain-containing protein [Chthoniobacterales bacterium]
MARTSWLSLTTTLFFTLATAAETGIDTKLFEYDSTKPLEVDEKIVKESPDFTITNVSFDGGRGDRASGHFVAPRNKQKHPVIIFSHELGASRTEFLNEAIQLARTGKGAASLLIDAPWAKQKPWQLRLDPALPNNDRELQFVAIANLRRAVDFLTSQPGVDKHSIAFVGHSFGANWGSILTAVEPRIGTFVLMAGVPSATASLLKEGGFSRDYVDSIRPFDPDVYLPHLKNKKMFLQFARYDLSVPASEGERFINLIPGSKKSAWYDCGHEMLDPAAIKERVAFLIDVLSLQK